MANYSNEDGVWRTIGGRRVFIRNGQSLSEAMKESGKFNNNKKQKNGKENNVKKDDLDEKEKTDQKLLSLLKKKEELYNNNDISDDEYYMLNEKLDNEIANNYSAKEIEEAEKKLSLEKEGNDLPENWKSRKDIDWADEEQFKKIDDALEERKMYEDQIYARQRHDRAVASKEKSNEQFGKSSLTNRDAKDLLKFLNDEGSDFTFDDRYFDLDEGKLKTNVGVFMPGEEGYVNRDLEIPIDKNETYDSLEEKIRDWQDRHSTPDSFYDKDFDNFDNEAIDDIDYDKFDDKARAKFGKIDYYGNGRKSNAVEIEMELKNGVFSASGRIKNSRGTDSISGGQNIDEIADLMKDNKDVQEIYSLWKKYHLNDMHAGTEKQEEVLEKFKSERKAIAEKMNKDKKYDWEKVSENDYKVTKKLLENHNLLNDNGYQYGTSWLKREIPDQDKKRIVELINKYNGKTNEPKTTNNIMNDILREKAYKNYLKQHPGSKMTLDEFKKRK